MSDFRPLGPPLPRPVLGPNEQNEKVAPGIWRRNGKLETVIPKNEKARYRPQPVTPVYQPEPIPAEPLPPTPAVDFILEAMEKLADPEFPQTEWGTW